MDKTNELLFDLKNKVKLSVQDLVLCALSKSGFFDKAVLHGEKARRIHYELDGFSGHLEFSLMEPDVAFSMDSLLSSLQQEFAALSLNLQSEIREKPERSNVHSVVLKGNTKELFVTLFKDKKKSKYIPDSDMVNVRFEVNVVPSKYAGYCRKKYVSLEAFEVTLYDKPSLFAEKIANTIVRAWKSRTKGCDLYDYAFYHSNNVAVNFKHLVTRLMDLNYIEAKEDMTLEEVKITLCNRFREINYEQTKIDLLPFMNDPEALEVWSTEYFCGITQDLTIE